ncbi:MAG: universal stress protein [Planctomycetota bacterium]
MHEFQRILVGVDLGVRGHSMSGVLSPPTAEAVARGTLLAEHHGAELTFATVLDAEGMTERLIRDARTDDPNVFDEARALLGQIVQQAQQHGISANARVHVGRSWLKLLQDVLKERHDLVVIGTRHEGMVDRVIYGSTALKLLRQCPCPVWVARPSGGRPLSSVLVAHDLGPVGRKSLRMGVALAKSENLQLHVVHGIEQLPIGDPTGFGLHMPEADLLHRQARERIQLDLEGTGLARSPEIRIMSGRPESSIVSLVNEKSIDLVVTGTMSRSGIRNMIIGNTAERLIRRLQCSLLVVKPDDFQCPVDVDDSQQAIQRPPQRS